MTQAAVATLLTTYVSLPLPFGEGAYFEVAYGSLNAPLVATVFSALPAGRAPLFRLLNRWQGWAAVW